MKVLELYSGIGGMHFALNGSTIGEKSEVVAAIEVNTFCNEVYKYNFPHTELLNRNIGSLTATEINELSPDLILMSPPCQPFTRSGKQKDTEDERNQSLLQFIELLPFLTTVSYILLENVKGFEVSDTRQRLISSLQKANYTYKEFLLNPRQFKICNSRLRYYLLAKRSSELNITESKNIIQDIPKEYEEHLRSRLNASIPTKIEEILKYDYVSEDWNSHLIPQENVKKYFQVLDIISRDDNNSCCFTRGYTVYFKGTGSILTNLSRKEYGSFKSKLNDVHEDLRDYSSLNLRYFTPVEIARVMMFPKEFKFPNKITKKQRYKMLCNSINIHVVSFLISYLIEYFND